MVALLSIAFVTSPLSHFQRTAAGAKLDVIQIDMSSGAYGVRIQLADGFPGGDESFASMVKRTPQVVAAINGAYFDKTTKLPIGDIFTDGKLVRKGLMGTAFCVRKDGTMDIRRVTRHRGVDWSEFESVLACGPALVLEGKVDCDPAGEGFRDPHVTGKTTRMGVGYDREGRLLLVRSTTAQTFPAFAESMLALGCYEAMNLDSGASRGFYYQGTFIEQPGRKLTNALAIVRK